MNVREKQDRKPIFLGAEKLMDHIEFTLITTDSFCTFEAGLWITHSILNEYGIALDSQAGQTILVTYVAHATSGLYGDVNGYCYCEHCGRRYRPKCTLDYAFLVLSGQDTSCLDCLQKRRTSTNGEIKLQPLPPPLDWAMALWDVDFATWSTKELEELSLLNGG